LVDSLGLIQSLVVHEANIHDSVGAKLVMHKIAKKMPKLKYIFADSAYGGKLIGYVKDWFDWILVVMGRVSKDFEVLPFRWIVERTFAWFGNYRGLSKDYEFSVKSSEGVIYLAMLHLMLNKIA